MDETIKGLLGSVAETLRALTTACELLTDRVETLERHVTHLRTREAQGVNS